MVAALPWQLHVEGGEHVEEGPGEDHVVVAVEEEHDDTRGQPDP